ncbi:MAG: NAD+ synthase, partial [Rhodobacteraceae bacterium]|nr:NAD+ synthase [Paracoccaceae bacterium]
MPPSSKPATFKIALAQCNPTVGDVVGNAALVRAERGKATGADVIVFPELMLSGYPPEDLVYRASFLDAIERAVAELAKDTADGGPAVIVGAPWRGEGTNRDLVYNAALVLDGGKVVAHRFKHHLPNYGVFD